MPGVQFYVYSQTELRWQSATSVVTAPALGEATLAGAYVPGDATYPVPASNVVYLSLSGSDTNDGLTVGAPKATLQAAVTACPSGGTVVVRGGFYEQKYSGNLSKAITIQSYPGEAVWFDGSKQRTTWTANGDNTWTATLFAQFDHATPGGYGGGIDPAFPMAVWPDMVHVDGVRLHHIPSSGTPSASQFKMDYTANTVTIGTNPAGKEVRLSSLDRFAIIASATRIRGLGIRRYATTLTSSTASVDIVSSGNGALLEHVTVEDCGQQSVSLKADNTKILSCTVRGASQLGIHGDRPDNYEISDCLVVGNNFNRWKDQPSAGGIKLSRATNGIIQRNIAEDNIGTAIWYDVSCYDNVVFNNLYVGNTGPDFEHEISRRVLVVNNWHVGAGSSTIWGLDSGEMRIWNNMVDRSPKFDIRVEEDSRAGIVSSGENPTGVQDWRTDLVQVCNNVLANYSNRAGTWRLYFNNISISEDASSFFTRVGGNVWSSAAAGSVGRMAAVQNTTAMGVYTTPAAFAAAMPAGKVGTNTVAVFTAPSPAQLASWQATAEPLPADVAALMSVPAGSKIVGPVVPAPRARY